MARRDRATLKANIASPSDGLGQTADFSFQPAEDIVLRNDASDSSVSKTVSDGDLTSDTLEISQEGDNVKLEVDIAGQTTHTVLADGDELLVYSEADRAIRKTRIAFLLSDDTPTPLTVRAGDSGDDSSAARDDHIHALQEKTITDISCNNTLVGNTDTEIVLTGNGGMFLAVNAAGNAVVLVPAPSGGGTTPPVQTHSLWLALGANSSQTTFAASDFQDSTRGRSVSSGTTIMTPTTWTGEVRIAFAVPSSREITSIHSSASGNAFELIGAWTKAAGTITIGAETVEVWVSNRNQSNTASGTYTITTRAD